MLTVEVDAGSVERRLAAGDLLCPGCGDRLSPWGWARQRVLRGLGAGTVRVRPRRTWCRRCRATHVLLPVVVLARRADLAEVIGAALAARAGGASCRAVAARLGRPVDTVRGWLRRFAARAEAVRVAFIVLLVDTGPDPLVPAATGSLFADAVAAIVGTAAAVAVAGGISGDRWEVAGPVLAMIADQHESPLPAGIVA